MDDQRALSLVPLPSDAGDGFTDAELNQIYYFMKLGRLFEERVFALYRQGRITGSVFLARGQEAMEVGCAFALAPDDIVSGTHRDQILALTHGTTPKSLMLNYFGKAEGLTRGRDGNSHIADFDHGVMNVVSHLPDGYPPAMGCALAFKLRKEQRVSLAICGEGAANNGTWHETVNFAAVMELPFIPVVQNNQYAYSTPNDKTFRAAQIAERAAGYGIPGVTVDGNNVLEVVRVVREAAARARAGGGPTLVEGETFRVLGHAGHDAAEYVPQEVRDYWAARDPVLRFEHYLESKGLLDEGKKAETEERIKTEIIEAVRYAESAPDPRPEEVSEGVFG